ncbi:MAG: zinc ribbon domain-containing protein [Gemmatimonadota bacterium]
MPTYEYRCPKGHGFEVFQRMSDDPVAECPECGAKAERLISGGAGFLFKGEGFYITNHRSDDYKKKASKEAPSSDGGSTGGEGSGGAAGGDKNPAASPAKPKSDD